MAPKIGLSGLVKERVSGQPHVRVVALAAKHRLRRFKTHQNEPHERIDVTERLQKQVGNLPIIRLANLNYNSNFGGDPAPGKPKRLIIEYRIDGRDGKSMFHENDPVVLAIPE